MSEITKLYENAGLSNMWVHRYNDGYYEHERYYNSYKEMINNMMKANDWTLTEAQEVAKRECKKEHPPFTAEKELKLIKWFMHSGHFSPIRFYTTWVVDDIASHINFLWEKLTEEEKQQVKGILE